MLEALVWDKVKSLLSDRDVINAELRRQTEATRKQGDIASMDKETRIVQRRLKEYPNQEKRLINALKVGDFTQDYVLDEINRTRKEREADLRLLDELKQAKIQLANLEMAEVKLDEFYLSVMQRIEQCTFEDKRLAFEALALKVKATQDQAHIIGVIPVDITTSQSSATNEGLLTTEQTSASRHGRSSRCRRA